jgi:drug/metabolite transporter (DMT)-like permease
MLIFGEKPSIYLFIAMFLMFFGIFISGRRSRTTAESRVAPEGSARLVNR